MEVAGAWQPNPFVLNGCSPGPKTGSQGLKSLEELARGQSPHGSGLRPFSSDASYSPHCTSMKAPRVSLRGYLGLLHCSSIKDPIWSLLDGSWGVLEGSRGLLVLGGLCLVPRARPGPKRMSDHCLLGLFFEA